MIRVHSSEVSEAAAIDRRQLLAVAGVLTMGAHRGAFATMRSPGVSIMNVACFIRYQIDPFQKDAFHEYARRWGEIIPRCGGHLIGYFLPSEGTNDIAWGLIGFESLAAYEQYRIRLRADPEAKQNFAAAQAKRFILREERTFLEPVAGTLNQRPV